MALAKRLRHMCLAKDNNIGSKKNGEGSKGWQGINHSHKGCYLINVAHKVKECLNHVA